MSVEGVAFSQVRFVLMQQLNDAWRGFQSLKSGHPKALADHHHEAWAIAMMRRESKRQFKSPK